jgi:hypothetical protein
MKYLYVREAKEKYRWKKIITLTTHGMKKPIGYSIDLFNNHLKFSIIIYNTANQGHP